jgi:hypothetical protein
MFSTVLGSFGRESTQYSLSALAPRQTPLMGAWRRLSARPPPNEPRTAPDFLTASEAVVIPLG